MLCGVEGQVVHPCARLSIISPSLSPHPPRLLFLPRSASVLSHRPLGFDDSSSPSPRGEKLYPEQVPQGAASFQSRQPQQKPGRESLRSAAFPGPQMRFKKSREPGRTVSGGESLHFSRTQCLLPLWLYPDFAFSVWYPLSLPVPSLP